MTPEAPKATNIDPFGRTFRVECWEWLRRVALGFSWTLWVGVSLCFVGRWDAVAVVTLPPYWAWGGVGALCAAIAWRIRGNGNPKILLALWLGSSLHFSDDLRGLVWSPFRAGMWRGTGSPQSRVRLVSLNCASQARAAEEAWAWHPDIVLLQESPSSNDVARLCQDWFGREGSFLYGLDCSIIARGRLTTIANPRTLRYRWGRLTLPEGLVVDVVSVRLHPPDIRMDLWSSDCWRQHRLGREIRRAQLGELVNLLQPAFGRNPMIVGGDFNAPAGDAIFRLFGSSMKECFREAGRGWGNTGINTCPISRPDQIWINPSSRTLQTWAKKTENSDHRMVLSDALLR